MNFILITLFAIGIVGLLFLLGFPVYILVKENNQKHDTSILIEADTESKG